MRISDWSSDVCSSDLMTLLPETRCTEASQVAFTAFPESRARLTAQRSTRRLRLSPKYGSGPREVEVSYLWCGAAGAPTVIVQGGISADRDVRSEEHTSELQSLMRHSYAVFCLKKKKKK